MSKTDRLQRLQKQFARILTKWPRREHITTVLNKLHWLKLQDRIIYKIVITRLCPQSLYDVNHCSHSKQIDFFHLVTNFKTHSSHCSLKQYNIMYMTLVNQLMFCYSVHLKHLTEYIIMNYGIYNVDWTKSHLVIRCMLFMYTNQSMHVRWKDSLSNHFSIGNGVR